MASGRCCTHAVGATLRQNMPTERPRLTITETDDVAEAIDLAAERWPETPSRRELLLRVVEQSRCVIERERDGSGRASAGGDPALEQRPDRRGNKGSGAEPTGGGDHESPLR